MGKLNNLMASLNIVTAYIDLLGKSSELAVVRERDTKVNKKKQTHKKTLRASRSKPLHYC